SHPVRERIPMPLAAIGPKNVALVAELYDEWQLFLFYRELADSVVGPALSKGNSIRDPARPKLGIVVQTSILITNDCHATDQALDRSRRMSPTMSGDGCLIEELL